MTPEQEHPSSEELDQAPAGPESLRTSNDEFLDDLSQKLDRPATGRDIAEQVKANRDWARIAPDVGSIDQATIDETVDRLDLVMETEVGKAQWAKLDQDSKE